MSNLGFSATECENECLRQRMLDNRKAARRIKVLLVANWESAPHAVMEKVMGELDTIIGL